MGRANYKFDKRQRDLAKQKKQQDKRLKKLARKVSAEPAEADPPLRQDKAP